jgi:hypothetical protein
LAWNALADTTTLSSMPSVVQSETVVDFCRRVGCDAIQLGDFSLPPGLQAGEPFQSVTPAVECVETTADGGFLIRRTKTPWGELVATFKNAHPLKYPVTNLDELRVLKAVWEVTRFEATGGWRERYQRLDEHIGEAGIYVHFLFPSPVQRLIEYELGLENFYYLLHDCREEVEALLKVMQRRWIESIEILASCTPAEVIISAENTSTTLISPGLYTRYSLPQIQEFTSVVHAHGKKAILHMCGWLKNLLPVLNETGLDGIHALTPPTVGDTPFELAMDCLGEKVTLMGILDGTIFHDPLTTAQEIWALLDRVYTPRVREGNFLLIVAADGLPTPLWKFEAVQEWMARNGR